MSNVSVLLKALQQLPPADTHIKNMALLTVNSTVIYSLGKHIIKTLS
jgi:hypothetical protein